MSVDGDEPSEIVFHDDTDELELASLPVIHVHVDPAADHRLDGERPGAKLAGRRIPVLSA